MTILLVQYNASSSVMLMSVCIKCSFVYALCIFNCLVTKLIDDKHSSIHKVRTTTWWQHRDGIRDSRLSEGMQLDADLTLESAKRQMRQKKAISEQGQQRRGDGSKNAPIIIEQVIGETLSKKPQSK